jgi:hypothetical protein
LYRVLAEWLAASGRAALLVSHGDGFAPMERVSFLSLARPGGD